MKRYALAITLMAILAGAARADEGTPMTAMGNRALLFSFSGLSTMQAGGLFTLTPPFSFPILGTESALLPKQTLPTTQASQSLSSLPTLTTPVAGIGLRWYVADNIALRGGIGFGTYSMSQNDAGTGLTEATSSGTTFGIQAMAEWHMTPVSAISPYLGAGLQFNSFSATNKPSVASSPSPGTITEEDGSATQFSFLVNAGFEWFFTKAMSLGGEYQLGISTTSGSETGKTSSTSTTVDYPSTFTLGTSAFSVILSFYMK